MRQVTAICRQGETAKRAVEELVEASFPTDDVSVILLERDRVTPIEVGQKTGVPIGMAAGGALGAALGLTAIVAFPGLLAAGPALALLNGAAATATTAAGGSLIGAYQGLGWWRVDADVPLREIEEGAVLVGIAVPEEREKEAVEALHRAGADRIATA
jgi:hypothetical protein